MMIVLAGLTVLSIGNRRFTRCQYSASVSVILILTRQCYYEVNFTHFVEQPERGDIELARCRNNGLANENTHVAAVKQTYGCPLPRFMAQKHPTCQVFSKTGRKHP